MLCRYPNQSRFTLNNPLYDFSSKPKRTKPWPACLLSQYIGRDLTRSVMSQSFAYL